MFGAPAICGDKVFFGSDNKTLYCMDAKTGKELAKLDCGYPVNANIAISDGAIITCTDGKVLCFTIR